MGGGGDTTTYSKAEPWDEAKPQLLDVMRQGEAFYDAGNLSRMPTFGNMSQRAEDMALRLSGDTPFLNQAQFNPVDAGSYGEIYRDLDGVKQNALESVLPGVASAFGSAGMQDSSMAMQQAGKAAMNAVAPIEYQAFNAAQDRMMQGELANQGMGIKAAALAPGLEQARLMPVQTLGAIGAAQDARADMAANQDLANFNAYAGLIGGMGGMGGTTSTTQPGASTGSRIAGSALSGIGTAAMLGGGPVGWGIGGLTALAGLL